MRVCVRADSCIHLVNELARNKGRAKTHGLCVCVCVLVISAKRETPSVPK